MKEKKTVGFSKKPRTSLFLIKKRTFHNINIPFTASSQRPQAGTCRSHPTQQHIAASPLRIRHQETRLNPWGAWRRSRRPHQAPSEDQERQPPPTPYLCGGSERTSEKLALRRQHSYLGLKTGVEGSKCDGLRTVEYLTASNVLTPSLIT